MRKVSHAKTPLETRRSLFNSDPRDKVRSGTTAKLEKEMAESSTRRSNLSRGSGSAGGSEAVARSQAEHRTACTRQLR